jgi:hypothetical protein
LIDPTPVRMRGILRDLAKWFGEIGGNAAAVRRAEKMLHIGGQQP